MTYLFGIVVIVVIAMFGVVCIWGLIKIEKEWTIKDLENIFKKADDRRIEPLLKNLKDIGVIKSWYYNGTYHAE
jgi:hypothetical protein